MENKVILIGGDHYNGLSLVRLFGKNGLRPCGIIVGSNAHYGFLRTSRYWEQVVTVETDSQIVNVLLDRFATEGDRPVVIPWSDGAAACIDDNYDCLSRFFILPSIHGEQRALSFLMDKGQQIAFAHDVGLGTASSIEIDPNKPDEALNRVSFPCIGKPIVSFRGEKSDICRIDDLEGLRLYLERLRAKGYTRILLQEYLSIDAEYDIEGFVCGEASTYYAVEKVRTWPKVGGPTSYAFSTDDANVRASMDVLVDHLRSMGFTGLFDVELFRVGDRLVFNEINWRNSAVCFAAIAAGVEYPLYWYQACVNGEFSGRTQVEHGAFAMCEVLDFHNVMAKEVSLIKWVSQLLACHAYAFFDPSDMRPLVWRLLRPVVRRIRNNPRRLS